MSVAQPNVSGMKVSFFEKKKLLTRERLFEWGPISDAARLGNAPLMWSVS